jgi:hypothetical protein
MFKNLSFKNQVNAIGGAAFLITGGFFTYEFARSRDAAPCGARYLTTTQFSLQKLDGAPLAAGELQARVGTGERGILEKASVIKPDNGSATYALDVKVGGSIDADTGVSFSWSPTGMSRAQAACLSYQVFLPSDFDFARGGKLPGLFGGSATSTETSVQSGFATRFTWDQSGNMGIAAFLSDTGETASASLQYSANFQLPVGRWVQLDQEVTLNSPNTQNGILRLWIDGRLKLEDTAIAWRGNGSMKLTGAAAQIGYQSFGGIEKPAKKQTSILVSPLKLSWQ